MDKIDWVKQQLLALKTSDNTAVIDAAIELIDEQANEVNSLRISMEGQIWSPKNWGHPDDSAK